MDWTRRDFIRTGAAAGGALLLGGCKAKALEPTSNELIMKAIPSSGERLPVIGIGTRDYRTGADSTPRDMLLRTLRAFTDLGGTVIDTAPSYGDSELVLGGLMAELDNRGAIFLATKVDRAGQAEGIARMEDSFVKLGTDTVDLMQVHNLRDSAVQLATMREWKAAGRIRYIGVTTSSDRQYEDLAEILRTEEMDFVQLDYSIANRSAADVLLPIAADRGIAVLVNLPYGRGRTFNRVGDQPLPDFAADFGAATWGQFFLKWVVSHPAVTVAIPGTTKEHHIVDNMGACVGDLPDAAMRQRMAEFFEALPNGE